MRFRLAISVAALLCRGVQTRISR